MLFLMVCRMASFEIEPGGEVALALYASTFGEGRVG